VGTILGKEAAMYECWKNVPEHVRLKTAIFFSDEDVRDGWKFVNDHYVCPFGFALQLQGVKEVHTPASTLIQYELGKLNQDATRLSILKFLEDNDYGIIDNYYIALGVSEPERGWSAYSSNKRS
jgi:hypothetical protein